MANPFASHWRGKDPLWKVFWLYGVLGSMVLAALYLWLGRFGDRAPLLQMGFLVLFAAYTAWILVSVWRCAPNTSNPYYGLVARGLTIAWAINAVMLVFFLELGLLPRLFG